MTRPRLRPTERAQQHAHGAAALLAGCRPRAPGPCSSVGGTAAGGCFAFLRHAALPSMTRSRTRCSSISVGRARRARRAPRGSPGRGRPDRAPPRPRWTRRPRRRLVGQRADQGVDLAARPDVDAAGGLVEQQHPAVAQQPPGEHDLLLVAAGQGADRPGHAGRSDVERARHAPTRPRARPTASRNPARAKRPRLETVMLLVDRLVEQQALALALLRGQADAGLDRGTDRACCAGACRRPTRCRWPACGRRRPSRGSPSGPSRRGRPGRRSRRRAP